MDSNLSKPVKIMISEQTGHSRKVEPSPGTPGTPWMPTTLKTAFDLRDLLEPLRTLRIYLGLPWNHQTTLEKDCNVERQTIQTRQG